MAAERFRPTPRGYERIVQISVAALSSIIVTGAAVRLTGSGLGCSDWPTCEDGELVASLSFHPMIEFVNRLITGLVSIAVVLAVLGSLRRRPRRSDLTRWSWVLVIGVVAQILIGAAVTLSELRYSVVAVHFLVSMMLVWAAMVLWKRSTDPDHETEPGKAVAAIRRTWSFESKLLVTLGALVLFGGAMVTSAGAHTGAKVGHDGTEILIERLPIELRPVVQLHSATVWLLCLMTVWMVLRSARRGVPSREAKDLLIAVVAQGALGYWQYFAGVPALLVGFHVAGATLVWILALRLAFAEAAVTPRAHPEADSRTPYPSTPALAGSKAEAS